MIKRISDIDKDLSSRIRQAANSTEYHNYNNALADLHDTVNDQEVFDFITKDIFIKLIARSSVYEYAESSGVKNLAILKEPSHRFEIEKIFKRFFEAFTLEESEEMISSMIQHGIEKMSLSYSNDQ